MDQLPAKIGEVVQHNGETSKTIFEVFKAKATDQLVALKKKLADKHREVGTKILWIEILESRNRGLATEVAALRTEQAKREKRE